MPITGLSFSNVGPFDDIAFGFNQQVNVFTGPNNSGKSTILWVLGELLVYPFGHAKQTASFRQLHLEIMLFISQWSRFVRRRFTD